LAEVALLVAEDKAQAISKLVEQSLITKASPLDLEVWRREKRFFRILIVQPFVLAQNFVALAEAKPN
ncbi:MAG: DUF2288 family protein, partial [Bdellovibrionales bacterium]|nr:DUF2288 family protein [Bdellovibrionales bacterium]